MLLALVFWPMVIRLQQHKRPPLHEEERTCMMLLVQCINISTNSPRGSEDKNAEAVERAETCRNTSAKHPYFPSWEAYGSLLVYFQLPFNTAPGRLQASSAQIPAESPRPGWHIGAAPAGHHLASARPFWGPGNHRWPTWSLGWTAPRLASGTQYGRSREMMSCFQQCPNFFLPQHFLPQIRDQADITWWSSESPKASPSSPSLPSLPPGGCHSAPPFPSGPTNPRRPWGQTADPVGVLGPSTAEAIRMRSMGSYSRLSRNCLRHGQ